jgi:hypothetical protein
MPEKRYFLSLAGFFLLGFISLAIAFVFVYFTASFLTPLMGPVIQVLLPFATGVVLTILIIILIWAIVYVCTLVGVGIHYFFKRTTWEKKDRGYSIEKAEESGKREKGESGK